MAPNNLKELSSSFGITLIIFESFTIVIAIMLGYCFYDPDRFSIV